MIVKLGSDQFVISSGLGFTTLGFKVCFERTKFMAAALKKKFKNEDFEVLESQVGTLEQHDQYSKYLARFSNLNKDEVGVYFPSTVCDKVKRVLKSSIKSSRKLRLFYGDSETGADWLEENEVVGTVGVSTGPFRVPLIIPAGKDGGAPILTDNIVKIVECESGKILFEHPTYSIGSPLTIGDVPSNKVYPFAVFQDSKPIARFKSYEKAIQWLAFMYGFSFNLS